MDSNQVPNRRSDDFQLVWKDIGFTAFAGTEDEKVIISNVSGTLSSGSLMAFLGPSGAGKTTLLETIIGKRTVGNRGVVEVRSNSDATSQINVAIIQQKDTLFNLLTVRESILFSVKLLISKKIYEKRFLEPVIDEKTGKKYFAGDSKYCDVLCTNIIRELGLEKVEHNRVGACSGGQHKRISIAQELASRPRIIFLDEATSGLDANSAFSLIQLLKGLARGNPTLAIMVSIHQPSVKLFNAFDFAYVMSKKGTCIYQGRPENVTTYLSKFDLNCPPYHNPADYVIEVASLDYGEDAVIKLAAAHLQNFEETVDSMHHTNMTNLASLFKKNRYPELYQATQLMIRSYLVTLRDPLVFVLRLSTHLFMSYFFTEYYGNSMGLRPGCSPRIEEFNAGSLGDIMDDMEREARAVFNNSSSFFFMVVFCSFSAVMPICIAFPLDMEVFTREFNNSWYTMRSYFIGRTCAEIPFQVILPALLAIGFYLLSNQPMEWFRMANFVGMVVLASFNAQSFGYFIGAILMENVSASLFFGPLSLFPIMCLSGFFVKIKNIPEFYRPFSNVSYMKFAVEGLLAAVYGYGRCGYTLNEREKSDKDRLYVWLGAQLGIFDENYNQTLGNRTIDRFDQAPTVKFVEDVVSEITDPFISKVTNQSMSLAMNEFDLEDSALPRGWISLIIYLIITRTIVYYTIKLKAKTYAK